jgi:hypothetical protein
MSTTKKTRRTSAERSKARYRKAAKVISPLTLDKRHADALEALQVQSGGTVADLIRKLIIDAAVTLDSRHEHM